MSYKVHGLRDDRWGTYEVVSREDHVLVRPIAKEIGWKIPEAIRFEGVARRFLLEDGPNGRTRFTIDKALVPAFRESGLERARKLAERHERRLREDAAYQKRVECESKENEIYADHRRETADALTEYQAEIAAADAEYGEVRIKAGARNAERKKTAAAAYNSAITEADEDRDAALAALND